MEIAKDLCVFFHQAVYVLNRMMDRFMLTFPENNVRKTVTFTKSILDFFTAIIFASSLGWIVSLIAVPQVVIFLVLFFFATAIMPLTTPDMISDFRACGGVIMMAAGFRILKLKMFPITDMIPAMFLVFPVSWFWSAFILPLVS